MKIDNIALIIAMRSEAAPLIEAMDLKKQDGAFPGKTPFEGYDGSYEGKQVSVIVSGRSRVHGIDNVATQPAALMTFLAIDRMNPDLIINAGTAGGMAEHGCRIGDVYLSEGPFCYHDRRIPLPRFREYGIGSYPSVDTSELAASLGFKRGRISTGDSLDMTDRDLEMIRENGAVIKEMEAAAVAWVCEMMEVPMFAVKAITDLIDRSMSTEEQFVANLHLAVSNLQEAIKRIIGFDGL